jgi:hypothetical protein
MTTNTETKMTTNTYNFTDYETCELIEAAGNRQGALDLATMQAEERTKKYFMPASWYAYYSEKTGNIVVKRYHN